VDTSSVLKNDAKFLTFSLSHLNPQRSIVYSCREMPPLPRENELGRRSVSPGIDPADNEYLKAEQDKVSSVVRKESSGRIPPLTISLPLLVFIDMLAVSLVVPLLFQYYRDAGITSANQRELLTSVFSFSQIIGGLVLGALTDAKILRRRTILFLSFGGSAVAYAMIVCGGFHLLIFSRVLVGLVKQTMTVTTSMLTRCTTENNRAKHMGRLESSRTAAWIIGPSVGALLYKHVDHKAPAMLASLLFVFNMILAAVLLRDGDDMAVMEPSDHTVSTKKKSGTGFLANLRSCFRSKSLGSVIASILVFSWITRATSYAGLGTYYEDMYGLEPHIRGYIQSYQGVLGFAIQSSLIGPLLTRVGGEHRAICLSAVVLALATFCEMQQSISLFILVLSPAIAISMTMTHVSLQSLLTRESPDQSIFSIFAALDVLQNASAVTVPFYRTFLFRIMEGSSRKSTMEGDPDPLAWVLSSGIHWVMACGVMSYFLWPRSSHKVEAKRIKQV
jgi:predicted MFS family arabinose efflux permease